MKTAILSLFTRTPLHVGAGASIGAIDQPVIRERHTGFPSIPGSALKGVLVDRFIEKEGGKWQRTETGKELFGNDDASCAGALSIGDAKLLAFPVRSARGCFAWITCPMLLNRWFRDTEHSPVAFHVNSASTELLTDTQVLLEGYLLNDIEPIALDSPLVSVLLSASGDLLWQQLLPSHLMVVSDEYMSHFCINSCEVAQHVCIDDATGTSKKGALFNQENVPAETLFYSPISELRGNALSELQKALPPVLQIGADATTGLGFCSANFTC